MRLQYGFDADGGFVAIDHDRQVAAYAYSTSPHQVAALKRNPEAIAAEMVAGEICWMHKMYPEFFARMVAKLGE